MKFFMETMSPSKIKKRKKNGFGASGRTIRNGMLNQINIEEYCVRVNLFLTWWDGTVVDSTMIIIFAFVRNV